MLVFARRGYKGHNSREFTASNSLPATANGYYCSGRLPLPNGRFLFKFLCRFQLISGNWILELALIKRGSHKSLSLFSPLLSEGGRKTDRRGSCWLLTTRASKSCPLAAVLLDGTKPNQRCVSASMQELNEFRGQNRSGEKGSWAGGTALLRSEQACSCRHRAHTHFSNCSRTISWIFKVHKCCSSGK